MTFLSLNIEKNCLIQQKNLLEYQEMCISMDLNQITEDMGYYQSLDPNGEDENTQYILAELEYQQEIFDSQKCSYESQLELVNQGIEGYEKAVSTNIKTFCKFSAFGSN